MPRNLRAELYKFVSTLPYWQKYLAASLLGFVNESDHSKVKENALSYFLQDNNLSNETVIRLELNLPISKEVQPTDQAEELYLTAIKNIKNVNAIKNGQTLPILSKKGLTVIYGANAAGKSGLARICNAAFVSRGDTKVLHNIYDADPGEPASATFVFKGSDGREYEVPFPEESNNQKLKQFASFDNMAISVHLNDKKELFVKPQELEFFEQLADLTSEVLALLEKKISTFKNDNKLVEKLNGESTIKTYIRSITSESDFTQCKERLAFTEEDKENLEEFEQKIVQLKAQSTQDLTKEFSTNKATFLELKSRIKSVNELINETGIETVKAGLLSLKKYEKAAKESGVESFKSDSFQKIGSPQWRLFLEAAKDFAELQEGEYPHDTKKCLLCKQDLNRDQIVLINAYFSFLTSDIESRRKTTEHGLHNLAEKLRTANFNYLEKGNSLLTWSSKNNNSQFESIELYLSQAKKLADNMLLSIQSKKWMHLTPIEAPNLENIENLIQIEIESLKKVIQTQNLTSLNNQKINLEHKQIVSQNIELLETWHKAEQQFKKICSLRALTTTSKITNTRKELQKEFVNKKLTKLFLTECQDLRAPTSARMSQSAKSGRSHRQFTVEGYEPKIVLSKGEQTVVSLADFLTEAKISGTITGLIFDDPVDSQDHDRREHIANKLVREAKDRQVIVFSHEISFISDLDNASSDLGVDIQHHYVRASDDGLETGIVYPNVRRDFEKGFIGTDKVFEKLNAAKSIADNPVKQIYLLQEALTELRLCYEAFVIKEIFAGVIGRMDRRFGYDRVKDICAPSEIVNTVSRKMAILSGKSRNHVPGDYPTPTLTSRKVEEEIREYEELRKQLKSLKSKVTGV